MEIWSQLFLYIELLVLFFLIIILAWYVHDKYVQRDHQLLVNYPIIGRLRYVLEEAREPFRQYFGDEKFYESKDKLDWVQKASRDLPNYAAFSPSQPLPKPKFMLRHATLVLNEDEVEEKFEVTFGENRKKPYVAKSIMARSAMSDGSISPEGTRAFVRGSFMGKFPINSGEGGLTSNFFVTHQEYDPKYMKVVKGTPFQLKIKAIFLKLFNGAIAADVYRKLVFKDDPEAETYVFDLKTKLFHRPNWEAPFENFPKEVPEDMPDIILQISSGLYSVRTKDGKFDPDRYKKVMSFCKMTEIKIVISDYENIEPYAKEIQKRVNEGNNKYPDFISIDGGSGGSATAPIEMMERIGLNIRDSIYLTDKVLKDHGVRDKIKIVASGKVLTPDDIVIILAIGADFIQIARGFMMSAGCIRARYCSGTTGHQCPVGLATQDKDKRKKYFVYKQAKKVANYHNNLLKGVKGLLAVMGLKSLKQLDKHRIMFLDRNSKVHDNIDDVFGRRLDIGKDLEDEYHESR